MASNLAVTLIMAVFFLTLCMGVWMLLWVVEHLVGREASMACAGAMLGYTWARRNG